MAYTFWTALHVVLPSHADPSNAHAMGGGPASAGGVEVGLAVTDAEGGADAPPPSSWSPVTVAGGSASNAILPPHAATPITAA